MSHGFYSCTRNTRTAYGTSEMIWCSPKTSLFDMESLFLIYRIAVSPFYSLFKLYQAIRYYALVPFFRVLIGSSIWSEQTKLRYERVFLNQQLANQKEARLLCLASSILERLFLRCYFRLPHENREKAYYIDVPKYITMHIHFQTGLLDPTLESHIDDEIASSYEPLRFSISHYSHDTQLQERGKAPPIFRLSWYTVSVKSVAHEVLRGVTRPFNVNSDADFSQLYYDILLQNSTALASQDAKRRIIHGEVSVLALSYRHKKDNRYKLGISKRELIAAVRALHHDAAAIDPPEEYCLWWDSCLRCHERVPKNVNWAAIGLPPYACCCVLSVRREGEGEVQRLWINLERVIGRLGKGFIVVDVSGVEDGQNAEVMGAVNGDRSDPEHALQMGLQYVSTGALWDSQVTFQEDKVVIDAASLMALLDSSSLSVVRGLYGNRRRKIIWVESLAKMEEAAFKAYLNVVLGREQLIEGIGDAYICENIELQSRDILFDDRRIWLPNSRIYELAVATDELPPHIEKQAVFIIRSQHVQCSDSMVGLLLFHEEETDFIAESVHGCITYLSKREDGVLAPKTVSKLHVPADSELLESFRQLYAWGRQNQEETLELSRLGRSADSVSWLWTKCEMKGDLKGVNITALVRNESKALNRE